MDSVAAARNAPLLDLPLLESQQAKGLLLHVARVATAPAGASGPALAWIETTEDQILRLPESLVEWAMTTVAVALTMANPFPSEVEFGIVDGRAYAEIL